MSNHTGFENHGVRAQLTLAGGAVLIAQAVLSAVLSPAETFGGSLADYLADGLLALALALTLAGVLFLRGRLGGSIARPGGTLAALGQGAVLVAVVATIAEGREALDLLYIVGFGVWMLGLLALGWSALRQGKPRMLAAAGLAPATVLALALFTSGGALVLGVLWMVIAARGMGALTGTLARTAHASRRYSPC